MARPIPGSCGCGREEGDGSIGCEGAVGGAPVSHTQGCEGTWPLQTHSFCSLSQRPGLEACADVSALEGVSRKDLGFHCVGCLSCCILSRKPVVLTDCFQGEGVRCLVPKHLAHGALPLALGALHNLPVLGSSSWLYL